MNGYYENKDWYNYEILVHALKSTAKMIGAAGLSENAKAAEFAAKENREEYIVEHHYQLVSDYRKTTHTISELIGGSDDDEVLEFDPV